MGCSVSISKLLIFFGISLALAGVLAYFGQKIGISFGKLPGDLVWEKPGSSLYFPIATCLIASAIFTLVLNLFLWIFRK
jgi:hypothetical protein